MIRTDDLRRDFKARRLRQIQFIRENANTDAESLAKKMIALGIYSLKTPLEEAVRRIVWERESPTTIGPKRRRPTVSVEQIQDELARFRKNVKKEPAELERFRKKTLMEIGR